MTGEQTFTIADLDVELSAIGCYDSVSGMPVGALHGVIRPWIRPEGVGEVSSLVSTEE